MITSWKDELADMLNVSVTYDTCSVRNYNRIFYLGDTVCLRSASGYEQPVLTINKFKAVDNEIEAECLWFDKNNNLCRSLISLSALTVVQSNGKTFTKDSS